jgi:hypothetical protein
VASQVQPAGPFGFAEPFAAIWTLPEISGERPEQMSSPTAVTLALSKLQH